MANSEPDIFRARWTYQYLRFAVLAVVLALFIAIALEWFASSGCFQRSVSAYYYTPVKAVFVSSVIALGVAMVVILGRNGPEDAFLNLAGLLAPVVAFVPTSDVNRCSLVDTQGDRVGRGRTQEVIEATQTAIDNNIISYFVLVALGLVAMGVLHRTWRLPKQVPLDHDRRPYKISLYVALVALVVGVGTFAFMRETFYARAHFVSASLLFLCVIVVVFANAYDRTDDDEKPKSASDLTAGLAIVRRRDPYGLLGTLMIASIIVMVVIRLLTGWEYWVLALEASLIGLFGAFWVIQTWEYFKKMLDTASASAEPAEASETTEPTP